MRILGILHSKSSFNTAFVWVRQALNDFFRRFPAWAVCYSQRLIAGAVAVVPADGGGLAGGCKMQIYAKVGRGLR